MECCQLTYGNPVAVAGGVLAGFKAMVVGRGARPHLVRVELELFGRKEKHDILRVDARPIR